MTIKNVDRPMMERTQTSSGPLGASVHDLTALLPPERLPTNLGAVHHRVTGEPVPGQLWERERQAMHLALRDAGLTRGSWDGDAKVTPLAIALVLEHHPYWRGAIRLNELTGAYECGLDRIDDVFATRIGHWFEMQFDEHKLKRQDIEQQYEHVARKQSYHPVKRSLEASPWDGTPRTEALLRAIGANPEHAKLHLAYLDAWLVGAVKRLYEPGCQFDAMLVLQGAQGIRKSSFFRVLAGGHPAYNTLHESQWQRPEIIHSAWIHEFAELESVTTRSDVGALKAQITSPADTYRPAYGRRVVYRPRTCVFVGSTNEATYLRDRTGNRRFWIIECAGQIDLPWVTEHRDQLWAEALVMYRNAADAYLKDPDLQRLQADLAREHEVEDPWESAISDFLVANGLSPFRTNDVLKHLGVGMDRRTQADSNRVGGILRSIGFVQCACRDGSHVFRGWKRRNA